MNRICYPGLLDPGAHTDEIGDRYRLENCQLGLELPHMLLARVDKVIG